jgi:kynurenine formamidase
MDLSLYKLIDLTHPLDPTIPTWRGSCGFSFELKKDYPEGCRVQALRMAEGIGTHIDSPSHFIPGGKTISGIALENLIIPLSVIDLTSRHASDLRITPEDLLAYEKKYGKIPKKSLCVANTGWSRYWKEPQKYRNPDASGIMRFPTYTKESAQFLLEREICGLGIDTLSPDAADSDFAVHHLILGAGKYIIENLTHLDQVPPSGTTVIVMPLNLKEGAESPIRAVALVPCS